jgi:hypothetical protein
MIRIPKKEQTLIIYLPKETSILSFNSKLGGYYDYNFGFRLIDDQGYYWTSSQLTKKMQGPMYSVVARII